MNPRGRSTFCMVETQMEHSLYGGQHSEIITNFTINTTRKTIPGTNRREGEGKRRLSRKSVVTLLQEDAEDLGSKYREYVWCSHQNITNNR